MKKYTLFFIALIIFGCKNNKKEIDKNTSIINVDSITKNFSTWYSYANTNIKLSQNFIALNTNDSIITKNDFLKKLVEENVVAISVGKNSNNSIYKLFEVSTFDNDIRNTIKNAALLQISNAILEGKPLPAFSFTDLNSNKYTNETIKNKTIVLKCWFINCKACVAEFPELNKTVDEFKTRKDIEFVSLASDSKEELNDFLKINEFKYATVANANDYMSNSLGISAYPTHLLINKQGIVVKVVNSFDELLPFLNLELGKK